MLEMEVAMTLRDLRLARGMSIEALARKAGVAASALSYWERGLRQPRYEYVRRLAQALDVPPEVVLLAAFGQEAQDAREADVGGREDGVKTPTPREP